MAPRFLVAILRIDATGVSFRLSLQEFRQTSQVLGNFEVNEADKDMAMELLIAIAWREKCLHIFAPVY